jgi:hypothetical protein
LAPHSLLLQPAERRSKAIAISCVVYLKVIHRQQARRSDVGWAQSLFPDQFDDLMKQVRQIASVVGRTVPGIGVRETVAVSK